MAHLPKLPGQLAHTLTRPAQGGLRIPTRHWLHQAFQVLAEIGVLSDRSLASASRPADASITGTSLFLEFFDALPDGSLRDAGCSAQTAEIPPQPIVMASAAANKRRVRSFSSPASNSNLRLVASVSSMPHSLPHPVPFYYTYFLIIPFPDHCSARS